MHTISLDIPLGLIHALRSAQHVAVLTGAGVSAESGVPTFREAQTGLWSQYNPEDLATPEAFRRQPALVWEWYAWRRRLVAAAEPNAAHRALAALETLVPRLTLITQNVDGLHQRAGSSDVIELHGNGTYAKCLDCATATCSALSAHAITRLRPPGWRRTMCRPAARSARPCCARMWSGLARACRSAPCRRRWTRLVIAMFS